MEKENVKVWYDKEADYLEVNFDIKEGFYKETKHEAVMEKVDKDGQVIGFSIQKVSSLTSDHPLSIELQKKTA